MDKASSESGSFARGVYQGLRLAALEVDEDIKRTL